MPRYVLTRDLSFFKQISKELVEDVVDTSVVIYKISVYDTKTDIYGESPGGKVYKPGVQIDCMIERSDQTSTYEGFGPDTQYSVIFKFQRDRLQTANIYPEKGDIINWHDAYFEIGNVIENQMPGGVYSNVYSIICETYMVRRSKLNIEERQR